MRHGLLEMLAMGALAVSPAFADNTMELTGTLRDFQRGDRPGGHPDFETAGAMNRFGHVTGMTTMHLGEDGKPVYNPNRPAKDTIQSAETFAQWYRDVPHVNTSHPYTLTLTEMPDQPGVFSYATNAFFPLDDTGYGNEGLSHNYHFTFELRTEFQYQPGQRFTFIGDDDVWVYINDVKVIDLGGVHQAITGSVLLFDGKAFVEKNDFPTSDLVKSVSSSERHELHQQWHALGLAGNCPIQVGDHYIDLDLRETYTSYTGSGANDPSMSAEFHVTTVLARSDNDLSNVVLEFEDGSHQKHDNLTGNSRLLAGTGPHEGKIIVGCWIKSGSYLSGDGPGYGRRFTAGENATLDMFFAERHTTEANFRIDTSIALESKPISPISPLYD
ncbi:fibro-slime domain-containing protein [Phycisphaerales bacterium AB-hyl4]|uniref:Fibro-slime domain-containing protein n=1 Tax=Natronomicrosphaera hydrolytica TaxID=3242702 RepID=A0ABV4U9E8_9BACT